MSHQWSLRDFCGWVASRVQGYKGKASVCFAWTLPDGSCVAARRLSLAHHIQVQVFPPEQQHHLSAFARGYRNLNRLYESGEIVPPEYALEVVFVNNDQRYRVVIDERKYRSPEQGYTRLPANVFSRGYYERISGDTWQNLKPMSTKTFRVIVKDQK